jgi:outer membrane immunogenic protein
MKRIALTALLSVSGMGSALAADLPVKAPPVAPMVASWTGFYAGLNAGGYSWEGNSVNSVGTPIFANPLGAPGTSNALTAALAGVTTSIPTGNSGGFIGGGQVGYNYQFNNRYVAGIEADIQGLTGRSSGTAATVVALAPPFNAITANTSLTADHSVQWLGTVRGRLGFTVTPTLLLYGTGGLAYGEVKSSTTISQDLAGTGSGTVNAPYGSFATASQTRTGWTAGAGAEWLIAANWTAKIEYLYYDLGNESYSGTLSNIVVPPGGIVPAGAAFYTLGAMSTASFRGDIFRVGINYKFSAAAP